VLGTQAGLTADGQVAKNPVMFVVEIGAVITTIVMLQQIVSGVGRSASRCRHAAMHPLLHDRSRGPYC
jgi:high-affinity K+ transport system ATPase subunit B